MLSYQHGYHAGNFADVVKHLTLARLLTYMTSKDKPILYLETHSGRGIYDLKDSQAAKTGEYLQGISPVWEKKEQLPALFAPYIQSLRNINPSPNLRFYPGSPLLAIDLLREQDRLYCCELHPREFAQLDELHRQGRRVHFSNSDGMEALKALLPPAERRGLIFIDPSYEVKTDYKLIPRAINAAFQRFSTGVYCLWYPLVDNRLHEQLVRGMSAIPTKSALRVEFNLTTATLPGMTGCGLWIINPPFTLADELKEALQVLKTMFNPGVSSFLIEKY